MSIDAQPSNVLQSRGRLLTSSRLHNTSLLVAMIANSQILLGILLVISNLDTILSYSGVKRSTTRYNHFLQCNSGGISVGTTFNSPDSVSAMMKDVAKAIIAARDAQISVALVDVPVPVTGMSFNDVNTIHKFIHKACSIQGDTSSYRM